MKNNPILEHPLECRQDNSDCVFSVAARHIQDITLSNGRYPVRVFTDSGDVFLSVAEKEIQYA